jgi:hypothetical protein
MMHADLVQHINLKVFARNSDGVDLADTVPVFHQWIREGACPEMLIDVANYLHVPEGPGVLLIGHQANYSLDNRQNRLGLLYNRKAALDGTLQDRLDQAHRAALNACERLEQEDCFRGKLAFDRSSLEVFVNDRLLAPNTDETWHMLRPQLEKYFPGWAIERQGEPRDLFRVAIAKIA